MKKNYDPELLVAFLNRGAMRNFLLYFAGLLPLLILYFFVASSTDSHQLFVTVTFLVLAASFSGAGLAIFVFLMPLGVKGYSEALQRYTTDKVAKREMLAKYEAIKASKPFSLNRTQRIVAIGAGCLVALLLSLTL